MLSESFFKKKKKKIHLDPERLLDYKLGGGMEVGSAPPKRLLYQPTFHPSIFSFSLLSPLAIPLTSPTFPPLLLRAPQKYYTSLLDSLLSQ